MTNHLYKEILDDKKSHFFVSQGEKYYIYQNVGLCIIYRRGGRKQTFPIRKLRGVKFDTENPSESKIRKTGLLHDLCQVVGAIYTWGRCPSRFPCFLTYPKPSWSKVPIPANWDDWSKWVALHGYRTGVPVSLNTSLSTSRLSVPLTRALIEQLICTFPWLPLSCCWKLLTFLSTPTDVSGEHYRARPFTPLPPAGSIHPPGPTLHETLSGRRYLTTSFHSTAGPQSR